MILLVNACERSDDPAIRIAKHLARNLNDDIKEVELYRSSLFDPKEFATADSIVVAAPHRNFTYPAVLAAYIEVISVEGITYGFSGNGKPEGLCKAKKLYYVTTAQRAIIQPDFGYTHIKTLCSDLWGIEETVYFELEGLGVEGVDAEGLIQKEMQNVEQFAMGEIEEVESKNKILVVDDSKVNILKAEYILKENGYEVIPADSGEACLKELQIHEIKLILLDIEMPGMNGFETLDKIRQMPNATDIPVIFVTAEKELDVVIKASEYKASGYVTKPFDDKELMKHVRRAMMEKK